MASSKVLHRITIGLDKIIAGLARSCGFSADFIRFSIVGTLGFCLDTTTIYIFRKIIGLYAAGVAGFVISASANWVLNRLWTFQYQKHESAHIQWPKFVVANAVGFTVNRGLFFALISVSVSCHRQPVLAVLAGTLAGLGFNYFLSKKFVFR